MPLTPSALVAPAAPSATNDSGVADGERWDVEAPPPPSGPRSAHRAHKLRQHGILRRLSRSSPRSSGPAPPAYKWHGEFSDRKLEEEYMRDEVLPILPGRVALSFLVMLMLGVMMIIVELVSSGADEVNLHRVLLETAVCVLWILASAYVRIAPRRGWPLAYVEYAVTWLFATSSVGGLCVIHFAPVFMSSMGARSVLHEDPLMVYVIAMVVLSVLAIAMPIRPVLFGAMAFTPAMTVATIESLHHFFSIGNLENREATALKHVVGTAFFCLFALSAAWVHAHVERVHRGAYHFFRDVELAAVENAALQSAEAEAKMRMRTVEAVKMARSRMIRMVMHDLRSPLLSVDNIAVTLSGLPPHTRFDAPAVPALLRSLGKCSTLMQTIVSDMLDFERIDSGRLVLVRTPFRPEALLQGASDAFSGLAAAKGVRLRLESPSERVRAVVCVGDERRLQQCLNNGVSNAIKFTERGGTVTLRVRFDDDDAAAAGADHGCPECTEDRCPEGADDCCPAPPTPPVAPCGPAAARADGAGAAAAPPGCCAAPPAGQTVHALRFEVVDTGPGLSAEEIRTLLSGAAFTQVGLGQLQGNGGTGLGLTLARHILKLHCGGCGDCGLHLASKGRGHGATFAMRLHLPAARPDALPAVAPPTKPATGGRTPDPAQNFPPGFRVLHVEDDRVLRHTLALRIFKRLGVAHEAVEDGARALELVGARGLRHFALVLMDNQMPNMGGEAATRALRRMGYEGVIVGMTGDPRGSDDRDEFESAGLNECLDKDGAGVERVKQLILELGSRHSAVATDSEPEVDVEPPSTTTV